MRVIASRIQSLTQVLGTGEDINGKGDIQLIFNSFHNCAFVFCGFFSPSSAPALAELDSV